jgi:Flp pilus assembly protein TadG
MQRLSSGQTAGALRERGAVFIVMVITLPVLLILASMAIDLGNYFRIHIYLQNAADAGALAGIGYAITQKDLPSSQSGVKSLVELKAQNAAKENVDQCGVELLCDNEDAQCIKPTYDTATNTLTVEIEHDIAPLFGFIKFSQYFRAEVVAAARRAPANVELVLDFSNSMRCPRDGACACLTPARTAECDALGVPLKVDDLREAVDLFLGRFDASIDRIGLTLFNMAAEAVVPIRPLAQNGFDPAQFNVIDTDYAPRSNTNIADGFLRGIADLNNAGIPGNEPFSVVFFSDGAPTAARFLFKNATNLDPNDPYGAGSHDYMHYAVQWDGYVGPSLLVKSDAISLDYTDPHPPVGAPGQYVPSCSPWHDQPPANQNDFAAVFSNCVQNLGFGVPGSGTAYASECGTGGGFAACWRKQYYHVAVQSSDLVRNAGGVVYAIGLGPNVNLEQAIANNDPFQIVDDSLSRKDIFLTRLANDFLEAVPLSKEVNGGNAHPEMLYTNYSNYSALSGLGMERQGRYYSAPTSARLNELFDTIARRILLRLTR